jgi:tetratricopeptide (TPR) repeat protein
LSIARRVTRSRDPKGRAALNGHRRHFIMRPLLVVLVSLLSVPAWSAPIANRGVQLFQSGEWAKAKVEFAAAVKRNDRDAAAHYYLGRLALVDDDLDTATQQLERAVKLDDNVSDYHLWYGRAVGQQAMRASNPLLAGRLKSECERAVALDARNIDARDALLDFYSMAPAIMGGDADKAREQAEAIAGVDAWRGHLARGRLAARAKDSTAVEREDNAAIAAAPDSLRGYSALANWYSSQQQWPRAFAIMDRYVARRPDDPYGPHGIGRLAAASGLELTRGEQGLRAFIAKPPKGATPLVLSREYTLLGQVLQHQGRSGDARVAFQRAVKLNPRNEDAKKALATP